MEAFLNLVMELTGNYVTPHGLYIPGGASRLFYWSWGELILLALAVTALALFVQNRLMARDMKETGVIAANNFMAAVDALLPGGDPYAPDGAAMPGHRDRAGLPDAADLERFYRSFPSETMLSDIIYAIRDEGLLDILLHGRPRRRHEPRDKAPGDDQLQGAGVPQGLLPQEDGRAHLPPGPHHRRARGIGGGVSLSCASMRRDPL